MPSSEVDSGLPVMSGVLGSTLALADMQPPTAVWKYRGDLGEEISEGCCCRHSIVWTESVRRDSRF